MFDSLIILAQKPEPSYSAVGGSIRQLLPESRMCSMFCGGFKCKYCNPVGQWPENNYAIKGLYSAWVTDNILAMSRPSTRLIDTYDILTQFKE